MAESRECVIRALLETFLPPHPTEAAERRAEGDVLAAQMLEYTPTGPHIIAKVLNIIDTKLNQATRKELNLLLGLLRSRVGTFVLGGRACLSSRPPFILDFARMHLAKRQSMLQGWSVSRLQAFRKAFKGIKSLLLNVCFTDLEQHNPLLNVLRYSPTGISAATTRRSATRAERMIASALVDLSDCSASPASVTAAKTALSAKGVKILEQEQVRNQAISTEHPDVIIDCDIVIAGSGAGGGVAAAVLQRSGLRVVVLEKGCFSPSSTMTQQEGEAFASMYENAGILTTENGGINVLAGSTLGGGTRINWCASWRTPDHVRREWAHKLGLEDFDSDRYDRAMDAVGSRLGVKTGFKHSQTCSLLKLGLEEIGAQCMDVPRNCSNEADCSGHCCMGCASADKQDTVNTWLSDSAGAGARIITGVWSERILLDSSGPNHDVRPRHAIGILAYAGADAAVDRLRLVVQARYVVSSCGAIHTPALLLRSHITSRGNVGKNLRLHPATCVVGVFPPSQAQDTTGDSTAQSGTVRCWDGALMTIASKEMADWEGTGYGSMLFTPATHPGVFFPNASWTSGAEFKTMVIESFKDMAVWLVITRDMDSGQVTIDSEGRPRLHYWPSKHDAANIMKGVDFGLKVMAAAGATRIGAPNCHRSFVAPDVEQTTLTGSCSSKLTATTLSSREILDSPEFSTFLTDVRRTGLVSHTTPMFSAHQMGSCAAGSNAQHSVVDMAGKVHQFDNLFLADASVFPTSTGVNPHFTVQSLAYMIAEGIAEKAQQATEIRGNERVDLSHDN